MNASSFSRRYDTICAGPIAFNSRVRGGARTLSGTGELAKAAINDLVSRPADDFDRALSYVLDKNRELYQRLA